MAKKILAFGASNSTTSINKQLATYAAGQLTDVEVRIVDLNDYEMPIYSIDREKADGIHQLAKDFKQEIINADGLLISFAEHNGAYTTAFKNVLDWISRLEGGIWDDKPMLLLATSPGKRGGKSVLELAANSFKHMSKGEIFTFSLPQFHANFSADQGIKDSDLASALNQQLAAFLAVI